MTATTTITTAAVAALGAVSGRGHPRRIMRMEMFSFHFLFPLPHLHPRLHEGVEVIVACSGTDGGSGGGGSGRSFRRVRTEHKRRVHFY